MSTTQARVSDRILYALGTMVEDERKVDAVIRYIYTLREDQVPCRFSDDEMRMLLAQGAEETRLGQGTTHEDFKQEMASWL